MHDSQDADAIYIRLKEDHVHNADEATEDIIMDFDDKGRYHDENHHTNNGSDSLYFLDILNL